MSMFLSIVILIAASMQSVFAQTTTVTIPSIPNGSAQVIRQQDIQVLAGETFEVLTWNGGGGLNIDGIGLGPGLPNIVVAGPKTVSIRLPENQNILLTYRLTTDSPAASQNVASQAVVIPESASAPVDVIFESSTDLINWTAAVAGSYAPSTSKRFFRVRLVTH